MKTYILCLVGLEQQKTVVIGGGSVAARKVKALIDSGARPLIISPDLCPELAALVDAGTIRWQQRRYRTGDLKDVFLVIAATDDQAANQMIWQEAQETGCLINVVDDPAHCNFILPAVVQRGDLKVAVTTGGASPALSGKLRQQFEAEIGLEYAELVEILAEMRADLMERFPPGEQRSHAAHRLVNSRLMEVLLTEGPKAARRYAKEILNS